MNKISLALLLAVMFSGCSSPATADDLDSSLGGDGDVLYGEKVSIQYLKTLYKGYPLVISEDYSIAGQIVSSDWSGNFPNSLIIEDESGAIEIRIGLPEFFKRYALGKYVVVRCSGLTLGSYGGTLQIGMASSDERYECGYIPSGVLNRHIILRDTEAAEIDYHRMTIVEVNIRYVNTPVRLDDVRFAYGHAGKPWADMSVDGYSERKLVSAYNALDTLVVRTHGKANFAGWPTPMGSGYIQGVLQCFNGKYSLQMIDEGNVLMD